MRRSVHSHDVECHPPDLVVIRWRGVMQADESIDVFAAIRQTCNDWSRIFLLQDFRELESIPLDTRRHIHDEMAWMPLRGTAFFGATFPVRAVTTMLMKVANLERSRHNPFRFFDEEEEARSFLANLREQGSTDERTSSSGDLALDPERLDALLTALSCASVDEFDAPQAFVEAHGEDHFGLVETAFQIFIEELAVTKIAMKRLVEDAEAARAELQARLETIERQKATIVELSTPMIEVADGVLSLPVVGILDAQRASDIMEALLSRIVDKRVRAVIVDLTGVPNVTEDTADQLKRMAASIRLLGSECMLTGLTPQVAQSLAMLGVDLSSVRALRTMRDGISACLAPRSTTRS